MYNNSLNLSLMALLLVMVVKGQQFDYEHQASWYDTFQECSLNRQSPIELSSNDAEVDYDIPTIVFQWYDKHFTLNTQCQNNGHTANLQLPHPIDYVPEVWQLYDSIRPHIFGGPLPQTGIFVAESVHFHWGSKDTHGSEHVIDSERYSMEMHIVHRNSKYRTVEDARNNEDGLAVLAVLFSAKSTPSENFHGLDGVLDVLESIAAFNRSIEIVNFSLAPLLGGLEVNEFFTYEGSLTTPPCSQAVTWIVFSHPIGISTEQMSRFHEMSDEHGSLLENNYRSLQARGNRKVYLRNKRKVIESVVQAPGFWDLFNEQKKQQQQQQQQQQQPEQQQFTEEPEIPPEPVDSEVTELAEKSDDEDQKTENSKSVPPSEIEVPEEPILTNEI